MMPRSEEPGQAGRGAGRTDRDDAGRQPARKQIYLRTVYALNPGIPHFVDVPGGWNR